METEAVLLFVLIVMIVWKLASLQKQFNKHIEHHNNFLDAVTEMLRAKQKGEE